MSDDKPLSQQLTDNHYKVLWDSLRIGCQKVLETKPDDLGAKLTLQYMDLIEAIHNISKDVVKDMECKQNVSTGSKQEVQGEEPRQDKPTS